jgi:uncharacterized iron-regulated membrane protein
MATSGRIFAPRTVRLWCAVHTWSSLICTLFLLVLALTGLPLIFHDELDQLLSDVAPAPEMPADTPRISVDRVAEIARERIPGSVVQFIVADRDEPAWRVPMAPSAGASDFSAVVSIDARTGAVLGIAKSYSSPLTAFLLRLHTNLFAGQFGALFLCFIGLNFLASVTSGVVIYAPFMRRQPFGTLRNEQGPRRRWLDLHNFIGISITLWLVAVGGTGVVNTLATQIAAYWQRTGLVEMIAPWREQPAPKHIVPPQQALDAAATAAPDMALSSIAMPGNPFAGAHHYTIFFRGKSPLTARILKPVLIEAETGAFTATRDLPWYAQALFVSQPLHFGDYGGLPLKIVWALLDLMTIVILSSGLYLWVARHESRIAGLLGRAARSGPPARIAQRAAE